MGLNIEELLQLDRLRDKKLEGTGVKRTIEVCVNPEKVLKETESHTYKTIEVVDMALVDLQNKGIVDEIVRMTFEDESHERSLNNHYRSGKTTKELHGFYLRYRQTDDSHPFNLLFRVCEKAYISKFENDSGKKTTEMYFEEDHRSQARLLCFEILAGANLKFNESFRKSFNLDITDINDFKIILLDLELAKDVRKYITKAVATEAHKLAFKGRNQDYILGQKKVNGKAEKTTQQVNTMYLDKKFSDNQETDGYSFIQMEDGVYTDETTLPQLTEEEQEELKQEDNLYKYLLNNIENILTKKQLLYLKAYLNNDDESYLNTIKACQNSKNGLHVTRSFYKKKIREYIEKYLNRDMYTLNRKDKFEFKESVLVALENILKQTSNKDIFVTLCTYLQLENNSVLENILIDVIYSLDVKYYLPIVAYVTCNVVDDSYIENEFVTVIGGLQRAYNWHGKNNTVIYNLNRNNKELVVESKINKILNNNKQGYVSINKSECYMSIRELKQFLEGIEEVKLTNKTLKDVLNKYGYDIDLNKTKKNYIEVYNVFILGHNVAKKKVIKKEKRQLDVSISQCKQVESYVKKNLKLDKILVTTKDIQGNLRMCDIRKFIEEMLEVKKITINEIYEILLQCGYQLDLKNTGKQINGTRVHAHKINKL